MAANRSKPNNVVLAIKILAVAAQHTRARARQKPNTPPPLPDWGTRGCTAERGAGGTPGPRAGSPGGLQGSRLSRGGCSSSWTTLHQQVGRGGTRSHHHLGSYNGAANGTTSPRHSLRPHRHPQSRSGGAEAAGPGAYRAAPLRSARRKREETPGQRATGQRPKSPNAHRTPPALGGSPPPPSPSTATPCSHVGHPTRGAGGEQWLERPQRVNPNPVEWMGFPIFGLRTA